MSDGLILALIVTLVVTSVMHVITTRRHAYWVQRYEDIKAEWDAQYNGAPE